MSKFNLLIFLCALSNLCRAQQPEVMNVIGEDSHQFSTSHASIAVPNDTAMAIHVISVDDEHNRTRLAHTLTVPPHSTGQAIIDIDTQNDLGYTIYDVRVRTDRATAPVISATVHVFVDSIFDQERGVINFGVAAKLVEPVKSFALSSRETAFKITEILEAPVWASAAIDENGSSITVRLKRDRPLGLLDGFIKLKTDALSQPQLWILAKVDSRGQVVPSRNPIDFSAIRQGVGGEQQVRLEDAQRKPFSVEDVKIDGADIRKTVELCVPDVPWCKSLKLTLPKAAVTGEIWARATVKIEGQSDVIPIEVRGLVFPKDLKVMDLNDPKYQESQKSKSSSGGDLAADIKRAVAPQKPDAPSIPAPTKREGLTGSTLHWVTQRDVGVYGYLIYRSDDEKGPFVRINKDIVKASGNGQDGGAYEWRDDSGVKGHTYWYYIGLVRTNGTKQQLSGPQKAVAK